MSKMSKGNEMITIENILKVRAYYTNKYGVYLKDVDDTVLAILANLKKETIQFVYMGYSQYEVHEARVISVKGNIIHMWEGYHKRKLNIKNLIVYHPAIYAALVVKYGTNEPVYESPF